jgi:hypothetical protein
MMMQMESLRDLHSVTVPMFDVPDVALDLDALGRVPWTQILSVSSGAGGSASVDEDGILRFTPTSGYTGTGSFKLLVTDTSGMATGHSDQIAA